MKTRIAPTPSGFLHAGNGAAFVLAWQLAREAGGKLLLRIDDLDAERVRPAYVEDIFATLHWLGIDWDEGPRDPEELVKSWSQHLRMARYHSLLEQLRAGGHLYACACSRKAVRERAGALEYDGHCRDRQLPLDRPGLAWRLRLPVRERVGWRTWPQGAWRECGMDLPDPVVRQRNGRPAYHIASLADDVQFEVDLIVRGEDLLPSTAIQVYLAGLLGLDAFRQAVFLHHGLVLDASGAKRSKSRGADSLHAARAAGGAPAEVHALAGRLRAAACGR